MRDGRGLGGFGPLRLEAAAVVVWVLNRGSRHAHRPQYGFFQKRVQEFGHFTAAVVIEVHFLL